MAGIKNILIIVNANGRNLLKLHAICPSTSPITARKWRKTDEIAAIN
jgi:hypothetical protein